MTEKSIHNQTQNYLQRNELLYIDQSGFRADNSLDSCFCRLTDMIFNGAENGKHTGLILIDLQKNLETLRYKILSGKMRCIGISDKTIKWFHSYLGN